MSSIVVDCFTEDLVLRILSKHHFFPRVTKIISWTIKPITSEGENFTSSVNILDANYFLSDGLKASSNFIVKCRRDGKIFEALEEAINIFEREQQSYQSIIQEMEGLLRLVGDKTVFAPKAIYLDDRMIVLENMKEKGYSVGDVKKGLDQKLISLIMQKLAKFHACSMVLYEKSPNLFKYHLGGNVTNRKSPMHTFFENSIKACIEFCKTKPKLVKYVPNLKEFQPNIITKLIQVFTKNEEGNGFNVLNHGDCWVNNFMFSSKLDDLVFIDFQEGYYGSPGIDINYLLCTSLSKDTYVSSKECFIKEYHETLSSTLALLSYVKPIPTLDEVRKEIVKKGCHGLVTVTGILPILLNLKPELNYMCFLEETEEAQKDRIKFFNNPNYEEILEMFFEEFIKINVLI